MLKTIFALFFLSIFPYPPAYQAVDIADALNHCEINVDSISAIIYDTPNTPDTSPEAFDQEDIEAFLDMTVINSLVKTSDGYHIPEDAGISSYGWVITDSAVESEWTSYAVIYSPITNRMWILILLGNIMFNSITPACGLYEVEIISY